MISWGTLEVHGIDSLIMDIDNKELITDNEEDGTNYHCQGNSWDHYLAEPLGGWQREKVDFKNYTEYFLPFTIAYKPC